MCPSHIILFNIQYMYNAIFNVTYRLFNKYSVFHIIFCIFGWGSHTVLMALLSRLFHTRFETNLIFVCFYIFLVNNVVLLEKGLQIQSQIILFFTIYMYKKLENLLTVFLLPFLYLKIVGLRLFLNQSSAKSEK